MNSIVRALNNIAISLSKIADALNNKAISKPYTSNVTTSTPVDNKVTITDYQVYTSSQSSKDIWNSKPFQKHKHDSVSQKILELSSKDARDILVLRLRNAVINDNGSSPLSVNSKYHDQIMTKHRKEWPSLWSIIDELIKDSKQTGLR
jgi:hypothetical protein